MLVYKRKPIGEVKFENFQWFSPETLENVAMTLGPGPPAVKSEDFYLRGKNPPDSFGPLKVGPPDDQL